MPRLYALIGLYIIKATAYNKTTGTKLSPARVCVLYTNLTPKGINAKLSVFHRYLKQMGLTYAVISENHMNKTFHISCRMPCKIITSTQIAKSVSGAIIKLRCNTSWKTMLSTLVTCTKCGKQYFGETGDHMNQRMNGRRDDWKHKRFQKSPVAKHFCSPEHDFLKHAALCCLDHNPDWTDRTRKARESYWIRRLNTLRPYGINKGDQ